MYPSFPQIGSYIVELQLQVAIHEELNKLVGVDTSELHNEDIYLYLCGSSLNM